MPLRYQDRPLSICIVSPYDLSEGGGVKHHAFELARVLREGGDQVTIFGPSSEPLALPGVKSLVGVSNIVSNGDNNKLGLFVSPFKLRRFFRENSFDVIHIHEPAMPSINYWATWLTPGIPKVATFHAYAERPSWGLVVAQHFFGLLQYPFFHSAVAVSEPAASHAQSAWGRPLSIVPNGIRTDVFTPVETPPSASLRLLFVGRLDAERKGFRYLLDAYQHLREQGLGVTLDVVGARGEAPEPPSLPGLTYHGAVGLSELVHRYQQCEVFVAPSTGQESFGIVLLEAMAVAKPIICSDILGYRQVVHPAGSVLVPPRDVGALAAAVRELAGDATRRRRMGSLNRQHAQAFDWRNVAGRLRGEYLDAIAGRKSTALAAGRAGAALPAARASTALSPMDHASKQSL